MKLRALALLTVFAFGCSAVRVPVSRLEDPAPAPPGVAIAEPQVELWLESSDSPTEAERAEALAKSRDALERALARHDRTDGDAETVLYVRERALARTDSRRSDQVAATAGMVIGAVVVIGVVIWAILEGRDSGSRSKPAPAVKPAPRPGTSRPVARRHSSGGGSVGFGVGVHIPITPVPHDYPDHAPPGAEPVLVAESPGEPDPIGPWTPEEADASDPAPALPPVAELGLDERGWFAGDVVILDLTLVDRRSGQPVWSRTVREDIDPRDAAAVARAVNRALADQPWAGRAAAPSP